MPYSNVPEHLWDKMDSCVEKVMARDGLDKSKAIAICHESIVKSNEEPEEEKGGPGSGHRGHRGREGERGGSVPAGEGTGRRRGEPAFTPLPGSANEPRDPLPDKPKKKPKKAPKIPKPTGTMRERILDQIEGASGAKIIDQDNQSILFEVQIRGETFRGIFYPYEWQHGFENKPPIDDFELETEPRKELGEEDEVTKEYGDVDRLENKASFGGSLTWTDYDEYVNATTIANGIRMASSEFEVLVANVLDNPELNLEDKAKLIRALAGGLSARSGFTSPRKEIRFPKVHDAYERVVSFLQGKEYEPEEPEEEYDDPSTFFVFKDLVGDFRWFGWVTNKWRDRDVNAHPKGEILTDEAHKEYVEWVDTDPVNRMPILLAWHTPETKHSERADWMDYADGFLMASGPLSPQEADAIHRVRDYDLGMSHGFISLQKDKDEGLITQYRAFENSFLPLEVAANPWTDFQTIQKEVEEMGLTKKKRGFLTDLAGEEFVNEVERETTAKAAELEQAGVDFKEGEEPEVEVEEVAADPLSEEEAPAEEATEELEPEPAKELEPVTELRGEVAEAMKSIGAAINGINKRLDGFQIKAEEKVEDALKEIIEETPRASLKDLLDHSVIGKSETRVDGRTSEAKDGPKETEPIPVEMGIGIPLLRDLKARNIDHVTGVKE